MNISQEFETIAAIATPIGTGGVGVIRISGDKSFEIAKNISNKDQLDAGRITYAKIIDNNKIIDEVLLLPFKSPHSYTGEDVIEIQCHGGMQVVKNILNTVLKNGARMAEKGEFTKRAFLNKKMDLSQAEAVDDLIHSKTSEFAIQSVKNLSGCLAKKIGQIRQSIFESASKIVAGIDFPEDVQEPEYNYLIENFTQNIDQIKKILSFANNSDILRQGIKIAITGRPNVGKSSLFNALLNIDRAIVTEIAGTTRDVITETIDLGIPVTLVDTAGIREDDVDKVEQIGIEYSKQSVKEADLILFVYDVSQGLTEEDKKIYEIVKTKHHIIIANKSDLIDTTKYEPIQEQNTLLFSVLKDNSENLKEMIKNMVCEFSAEETEFITNARQQSCLINCKTSLEQALEGAKRQELQDMIYIDLKSALLALDELTGEVVTEEILDNIFSHFCIGK